MLKIMITYACCAAAVRPRVRLDLFLLQPKFLISMATFRRVATHFVVFSTFTNLEMYFAGREFITDFKFIYVTSSAHFNHVCAQYWV